MRYIPLDQVPPPEFSEPSSGSPEIASGPTLKTVTIGSPEPTIALKGGGPVSPSQPLQPSASNTLTISSSHSSVERLASPSPLGTADSNVAPVVSSNGKAAKRVAGNGVVGAEKRKKALKRL